MNPIHNLPSNEELFQNSLFSKSRLEIDNVEKVDRGYPVKNKLKIKRAKTKKKKKPYTPGHSCLLWSLRRGVDQNIMKFNHLKMHLKTDQSVQKRL